MKHVFILNPKAGKYSIHQLKEEIEKTFGAYDYVIEETKGRHDATRIAKEYARTGLDLCFYACGGDGTLHEVVNGMYHYPNAKLAIFPIGTGNDFIKCLKDYEKEDFLDLSNYLNPCFSSCDLLQCHDFVAINTLSAGLDVSIAKNVEHFKTLPFAKGAIPYYLSLLYSFVKELGEEYTLLLDGKKLAREFYSFVVACNGTCYGGGFHPSPNAIFNDGWIDVCLIKKVARMTILRLSKKYKTGGHLSYRDLVSLRQVKSLQILSDHPILLNADGEIYQVINPIIQLLPNAITLCLPKKH